MRKARIQTVACMREFPARSPDQLHALLRSFRKATGLTQAETALRLGITQQTYSALECNANKVSAERLHQLLNLLGVELALQARPSADASIKAYEPGANDSPVW